MRCFVKSRAWCNWFCKMLHCASSVCHTCHVCLCCLLVALCNVLPVMSVCKTRMLAWSVPGSFGLCTPSCWSDLDCLLCEIYGFPWFTSSAMQPHHPHSSVLLAIATGRHIHLPSCVPLRLTLTAQSFMHSGCQWSYNS